MRRAARQQLIDAISAVARRDGVVPGPVPGTLCLRQSRPTARSSRRWRATLALGAQGSKELVLGARPTVLRAGHFSVTPLPYPVQSRFLDASPEAPFLCLLVELTPSRLLDVVSAMAPRRDEPGGPLTGLFIGELDPPLIEAAVQLVRLFDDPESAAVLGPGRVRELLFHVLRGPVGPGLRRFATADAEAFRIAQAVRRIESELTADLDVNALASEAGMSRTVFYERFARVTSTSPLQYQKRLRLLEAQRQMVDESRSAESASYNVGYRSPSQFSRDYSRLFGQPPGTHARALRDDRSEHG